MCCVPDVQSNMLGFSPEKAHRLGQLLPWLIFRLLFPLPCSWSPSTVMAPAILFQPMALPNCRLLYICARTRQTPKRPPATPETGRLAFSQPLQAQGRLAREGSQPMSSPFLQPQASDLWLCASISLPGSQTSIPPSQGCCDECCV